jgi:glutathione synthase/RimK-type ligase-like ATP-grasp enzyme
MGYKDPDDIRRPLNLFERKGVKFINDNVKEIIPSQNKLYLKKRAKFLTITLLYPWGPR